MVVVHPRIAPRLHGKIYTRVVGEQVQEVIQESHPGLDLGPSFSVHVDVDLYVCFGRLALRTALARHLPPASLESEHSSLRQPINKVPAFWTSGEKSIPAPRILDRGVQESRHGRGSSFWRGSRLGTLRGREVSGLR